MSHVANSLLKPSTRRAGLVRGLATLAAVLLVVVLIGSLALFLTRAQQAKQVIPQHQTQVGASHTPAVTTGPTYKQGDTVSNFVQPGRFYPNTVAWSPDGKRIVSAGDAVATWNPFTGKQVVHYTALDLSTGNYTTAQWSPDGTRFAIAGGAQVQVWAGNQQTLLKTLSYHFPNGANPFFDSLSWSADGHTLRALAHYVVGYSAGGYAIVVFNVATGKVQVTQTPFSGGFIQREAWSADGNYLAVSGFQGGNVSIIKLANGQVVQTFTGPASDTIDLSWSPDGKRLAGGFADVKGHVYSYIWNVATGNRLQTLAGLIPAWSPDSKYIATVAPGRNEVDVQVWDAASGKIVHSYKMPFMTYVVSWSPDSKYIATSGEIVKPIDKTHKQYIEMVHIFAAF